MRVEHAAFLRHAVLVLVVSAALVAVGAMLSRGDDFAPKRVYLFAVFLLCLVSMMAGMIFYLVWRIGGNPTMGWFSAAVLFTGLQSFPFVVTSFADPSLNTGQQSVEILVGALSTLLLALANGRVSRGLRPLLIGITLAALTIVTRHLLLLTQALPPGWDVGTALSQKALIAVLAALAVRFVLTTPGLSHRAQLAVTLVVLTTGVSATFNSRVSEDLSMGSAVVSASIVCLVAVLLLDGSVRAMLDALDHHQQEMETMARAALRAEAEANREQELLHEIRSTVGGLATASHLLTMREGLSPTHRASLQSAMTEELRRVNRSVVGTLSEVQTFPLMTVVGPVVEFHRADGRSIIVSEPPEELCVSHVPDSVTQVLGTLLHNAARHAPGRPLTISAAEQAGQVLVHVSQPGPAIDPAVRDRLFQRGVRSTGSPGQGLGLSVARRLMREHGGDLAVTASSDTLTTFVMTVPSGAAG